MRRLRRLWANLGNSEIPRDHLRHESNYRSASRASGVAEAADHQGPLRGPGPLDNRLFPADEDPQ
jgi:hypothetical protein